MEGGRDKEMEGGRDKEMEGGRDKDMGRERDREMEGGSDREKEGRVEWVTWVTLLWEFTSTDYRITNSIIPCPGRGRCQIGRASCRERV